MNAAARRWAGSEVRRRWRPVVVLAFLTALAGGAALTAIIGAHRSAVVVDETMQEHRQPHVMSLPNLPGFDWTPIVDLPYVESYGLFAATALCLKETGGFASAKTLCTQPPVQGGWYDSIWRLDVLQGRMPTRPSEIAINRLAQHQYGWRVGTELRVLGVRPGRLEDLWAGRPRGRRPWGPTFEVTVAAVVRGEDAWRVISGGKGAAGFVMSRSFIPTYGHLLEYREQAFLRLRGGEGDVRRLHADITRITGDPAFPIRNVGDAQRRVERGTGIEAAALALFAAAVVTAAAVLLGQALFRLVNAGVGDAHTLRSLGMSRRAVVAALAAPGAVVGALGAVGAILIAVAASSRVPIGLARSFDLHAGTKVDLPMLGLGASIILVGLVLASLVTAALAIRAPQRAAARGLGRAAALAARLPLPPAVALGVRMALERRRGADSIPIRPGLIGAAVAVLAVVAAFTVRQGIVDTLSHPEWGGKTWELAYFPDLRAKAIANDEDVAGAAKVTHATVDLDGLPVPAYAFRPVGRPLEVVMLGGRAPRRDDEIALGPSTATALDVGVGDSLPAGSGAAGRVRVVGKALLVEEGGHAAYDEGAWTTPAGLERLEPQQIDWIFYFVHVRPGADIGRLRQRLAAAGGVPNDGWPPPAALDNLQTTQNVPSLLGALLALLGAGAVGHMLATTVRRRGHDLAVLRALGLSSRQTRLVLAAQASTVAVVGLALGIPLGVLAGHLIWRSITSSMPLAYVAPGFVLAAGLVIPAAFVVVNAVAVWPAHAAARIHAAAMLRAE